MPTKISFCFSFQINLLDITHRIQITKRIIFSTKNKDKIKDQFLSKHQSMKYTFNMLLIFF